MAKGVIDRAATRSLELKFSQRTYRFIARWVNRDTRGLKRAGVGAQIGYRQTHRYAFGEAQRKSDKEWVTQRAIKKKNKSDIELKKKESGNQKRVAAKTEIRAGIPNVTLRSFFRRRIEKQHHTVLA